MTRRNLILTGGIGHPFEDAAPALQGVLKDAGVISEITFDIESGLERLEDERFDMLTVYALRWRMLQGEKYAPHRAEWGFSLSPEGRERLSSFIVRGGCLLALHTAVICFDDWPEWGDMLGSCWEWGRSAHPPRGEVTVRPTSEQSVLTARLPGFHLDNDEVYGSLRFTETIVPLLVAEASGPAREPVGGEHPVLWTRAYGEGRIVCDLLGHDRASLEHPVHRRILTRSALWLLGATQPIIEAA